jgi:glutamate dehydrogenase/leucine dehydrogenase
MSKFLTWPGEGQQPVSLTLLRLPAGCQAVVSVDDVTLGPAIGGVRMSPDVTVAEVARLARAMTLKNAAAGLAFGGGKAGIRTPQRFSPQDREAVVRSFAYAIRHLVDYIPGPDMGTDETAMAWIRDEIGRAVGLPALLGGIPLDEVGATGYGLAVCAQALDDAGRLELSGARVAIQGFGAVGRHAARFLQERGARVVAVADRSGGVYEPAGLDVAALTAAKLGGQSLADLPDLKPLSAGELIALDCDMLVPAAQPDVVHHGNADSVRAKVIVPGANIAVTDAAERSLHARGVLCVPDFLANAGGVICAAVEYRGGDQDRAFKVIEKRISANTAELLDRMRSQSQQPRMAAERMALERIEAARGYRRTFSVA